MVCKYLLPFCPSPFTFLDHVFFIWMKSNISNFRNYIFYGAETKGILGKKRKAELFCFVLFFAAFYFVLALSTTGLLSATPCLPDTLQKHSSLPMTPWPSLSAMGEGRVKTVILKTRERRRRKQEELCIDPKVMLWYNFSLKKFFFC